MWHRATDPNDAPSDTTFAFRADGMFILSTVIRATYAGQTAEYTCTFTAPLPAPPWPPAVGKTFSGHADCGNFTADVAGRINGTRQAVVDGSPVDVYVVDSTVDTHGQVESHGTQTDWFAPSLRLTVHSETHQSCTYGVVSFSGDLTADLVSARPS